MWPGAGIPRNNFGAKIQTATKWYSITGLTGKENRKYYSMIHGQSSKIKSYHDWYPQIWLVDFFLQN